MVNTMTEVMGEGYSNKKRNNVQALLEEETKQKLALQTKLRNVEQQLEQARDQLDEEEEAKANLEKQVNTIFTYFSQFILNVFNILGFNILRIQNFANLTL